MWTYCFDVIHMMYTSYFDVIQMMCTDHFDVIKAIISFLSGSSDHRPYRAIGRLETEINIQYWTKSEFSPMFVCTLWFQQAPQWGAADAEIKVPSGEITEVKRSPFKAWSKSVYSHTCYAYSQGFLSCLFLHFWSIHLHFFQNLSRFFPVLAVANTWFLCRPAE